MPTISRVRIVNFSYNDGKRRIADEVFNFKNGKGESLDALLNMKNGGGKSVLVQLMLQPIVPRAQLNNRKIEDYFVKTGETAFIMLEWKLDNSKDYLLCGIALSPGESENEQRGAPIRFFTFISTYGGYVYKYDIQNLEFATKRDRKYSFMNFKTAREYIKKINNIKYYSSDDKERYFDELSHYNISHNEWDNVVRQINNQEGGVKDFFDNYKTSDSLLNNLLIKTIDSNAVVSAGSNEDNTLTTMLFNYANRVLSQSDNIALRRTMTEFKEELLKCKKPTEKLWDLTDKYAIAVGDLFSFVNTLELTNRKKNEEQEKLQEDEKRLYLEKKHIVLEEKSYDYIQTSEELAQVTDKLNALKKSLKECNDKITQTNHNKDIQDAARHYEELIKAQNEYDAVKSSIYSIENNIDNKEKLNILKYSIYSKASDRKTKIENDLINFYAVYDSVKNELPKTEKILNETQNKFNINNENSGAINAKISSHIEYSQNLMNELNLDVAKKLDNRYDIKEIQSAKVELENRIKKCENKLFDIQKNIEVSLLKQENLREEKIRLSVENSKSENNLKQQKILENDYNEKEKALEPILERNSIPFDQRFRKTISDELKNKVDEIKIDINGIQKEIEKQNEQKTAVLKGKLHVSNLITDYLDELDIKYQTGEEWLQDREEGVRASILNSVPSFAYSILILEKDWKVILENKTNLWLPSLALFYSYDEVDRFLQSDYSDENRILACYENKIFTDKINFINGLNIEILKYNDLFELKNVQIKQLESDIKLIESFNFDENYHSKLKIEIEEINIELSSNIDRLINIAIELEGISLTLKKLEDEKGKTNKEIDIKTDNNIKFDKWEKSLDEFYGLLNKQDELQLENKMLQNLINELIEKINNLKSEGHKLTESLRELKTDESKNNSIIYEYKGAVKTEVLDRDIDALIAEYKELSSKYSKEIVNLKRELDIYKKSIESDKKAISHLNVEEEEYTSCNYSEALWEQLKELIKSLISEQEIFRFDNDTLNKQQGKLSGLLEKLLKSIIDEGLKPLEKSEIGSNFKERINIADEKISINHNNIIDLKNYTDKIKFILIITKRDIAIFTKIKPIKEIPLLEDIEAQYNNIRNDIDELSKKRNAEINNYKKLLDGISTLYNEKGDTFDKVLKNLKEQLLNVDNIENDKYFTISESLETYINTFDKLISELTIKLEQIDQDKKDLTIQCLHQGKIVYEQLKLLSKCSEVLLPEMSSKRKMIKFDFEDEVDENASKLRFEQHIGDEVNLIVNAMIENQSENDKKKLADKAVSSRELLNKYIGKENILVKVFKVDVSAKNSDYRIWENAIKENSGGEKFVVFFSCILSLMYYTRTKGGNQTGVNSGVLIMDNPFGPISSEHLLKPMFAIAKKFNVQLICLSDLDTVDIVSCFDLVYNIKIKPIGYSNSEVVEFTSNNDIEEMIEQGFYRSEQLSIF